MMHATKALQNGENPPEIYVSDGSMAERVGFEPTDGCPSPDFEFLKLTEKTRKIAEDSGI